ncbi:MAG: ATP-binding protein [Thermosphaera sp.]
MKPIGVVSSGSTVLYAPIQVFKASEADAREESLVVIKDSSRGAEYLGVLRNLRMNDPLLIHSQRSSIIDNPELARMGVEVVFENSYVRILGEVVNGAVQPASRPPTPRSIVELVEDPGDVSLRLGDGLVVGRHKYSGLEIPMDPRALNYHIGVVGATGTGKSRLVLALINEVLAKTDWRIIVFDHSGLDYAPFSRERVVDGSSLLLDAEVISSYIGRLSGLGEDDEFIYLGVLAHVLLNSRYAAPQQQPRGLGDHFDVVKELLREVDRVGDLEDVLKNVKWSVEGVARAVSDIITRLRERDVERARMKYEAKLKLYCRKYVEALNERRLGFKELLKQAWEQRLIVVDLSRIEQEEKRFTVSSVLKKLWDMVDERREPVNTLVVIDEAHNYACYNACSPSSDLIERSAREGRKWGIGLVLVSQRIIDFSPDTRNNINTFFFSRLQTPGDLQNLQGVLDLGGIGYENLAILGQKEFFFAGLGNPLKYPVLLQVKQVGG